MTFQQSQQYSAEEFVELSPEEIREHIDSGQTPPTLSDEQLKQLPPSTLDSYIVARESAGDFNIFSRVQAMFAARSESSAIREELRRDLSSQDIQYRDGLPPSDSNYAAIDHQKLKQDIDPVQAEGVTVYSDGYHKLHQLFQDLSDGMNTAVGKSKQEWEGGAADNAHGYFSGLGTWADGNSQNARMASDIVNGEAEAAVRAKNSMPEPVPFDMEKEQAGWSSNPFTMISEVNKSIEKMEQSQARHDEAVQVMARYDTDLQDAGSKQPVFAEPPKFGGAAGAGDGGVPKPSGVQAIPGGDASTNPAGYSGAPGGSVPGGGVPSTVGSGGGGGFGSVPGSQGPMTGAVMPPAGTRPSGFNSGGSGPSMPGRNGSGRQNNFGAGVGGAVPMGGMAAGGFGPGGAGAGGVGGRGMSGGFGPGGGAGAGAGAAGPGAGAATGAKAMGGPAGAAGPGAAAAASGGAGAGGRGGMPMGGGAGGKGGQGGEDSDHQRPTFLVEADPDDVFGTRERTSPPVIGM